MPLLVAGAGAASALFVATARFGIDKATLLLIGLALGVTLYHGAFGFTGAYRRAFAERDGSGVTAQALMLALAMVLFAPLLSRGEFLGEPLVGAVAPVGVGVAFGAFIFGIGMQLGGGCASGTLYTVGGGSLRMLAVLAAFCLGGFWASLDLAWWSALPGIGAVSLIDEFGAVPAVALQLAVLGLLLLALRAFGLRHRRSLWWTSPVTAADLVRGPWPLLVAAALLALLNLAILTVAGHPWSITWGFTLWAAKLMAGLGWDPSTSGFWRGGYQQTALENSILADDTSVTNLGIVLGALLAAALAGSFRPVLRLRLAPLAMAVVAGLLMGYGARLAYGCNIGAFFSGVASTSLHGWLWIAAAVPGNYIGWRIRKGFAGFLDD